MRPERLRAIQVKAAGTSVPGEDEAEDGSERPGDGGVEDEAGLAGVPGGGVGPVWEGEVGELGGGFEPA